MTVVSPWQVRVFAKAAGTLAKTGRDDARVLAQFAEAIQPEVRRLKVDPARELDAFSLRRRQRRYNKRRPPSSQNYIKLAIANFGLREMRKA